MPPSARTATSTLSPNTVEAVSTDFAGFNVQCSNVVLCNPDHLTACIGGRCLCVGERTFRAPGRCQLPGQCVQDYYIYDERQHDCRLPLVSVGPPDALQ